MALLEASVVIYLKELYYQDGFTVAMKMIKENILITEIAREGATIVMLIFISIIAGKNKTQRFAIFLLSFAVWDIFYYIWLKVFIDWPESFFTLDILFLIPITWIGPVLAPVVCSLTMILLSLILLEIDKQNNKFHLQKTDWILLISGSVVIIFTFIKDYAAIIIRNNWLLEMDKLMQNKEFLNLTSNFIPASYNWTIFIIGEMLILLSIMIITLRDLQLKTSIYKGYE